MESVCVCVCVCPHTFTNTNFLTLFVNYRYLIQCKEKRKQNVAEICKESKI